MCSRHCNYSAAIVSSVFDFLPSAEVASAIAFYALTSSYFAAVIVSAKAALSVGASAVGALTVGALAVGALAVGALAVGVSAVAA